MIAMHKINSYISSLIINQLSKYVKNFNAKDFQISLWNGEAALQNLELRTDALNDIPLPVEFISGHIIDLTIEIPWSNIMSESIHFTINTFELVLKMKNLIFGERDKKNEKSQKSQTYMQMLTQKILGNICADCKNIIIKIYIEDVVISITVLNITVESADENWEKAFANCNLRKMVEINGFSMCFDKLNNNLMMDVTQEPLFSNFSAKIRILREHKGISSTLLIHLFSSFLGINFSSLYIGITLRLIAFMNATVSKISLCQTLSSISRIPETVPGGIMYYLYSAWGVIRDTFSFKNLQDINEGDYINVKIFLGEFHINFKFAEILCERILYAPICRLSCQHVCADTILSEDRWLSAQCGVNSLFVMPLGHFEKTSKKYFISAIAGWVEKFLQDSLFDENAEPMLPKLNLDGYLEKYNDLYVHGRGYAIWIDFVRKSNDPREIENVKSFIARFSVSELKISPDLTFIDCMEYLCEVLDSNLNETCGTSRKFVDIFEDLKKYIPLQDITVPFATFQIECNIEENVTGRFGS